MSRRRMMLATMGAYVPPVSTFYRPSSDVSNSGGSFLATGSIGPLWAQMDETPFSDSDYAYSFNSGAANFVVGMTGSTISANNGAVLRVRAKWVAGGTKAMTISLNGTAYISVTLTSSFVTYEVTLTKTEADALISAGTINCTLALNGRCQASGAEIEFLG